MSPKLYVERASSGHVEAGVRGTRIRVLREIGPAFRSPHTPVDVWEQEMTKLAQAAEADVRQLWLDAFAALTAVDAPPPARQAVRG